VPIIVFLIVNILLFLRKSIFETTPDELLDDEKLAQLKKELGLKVKIRHQLRVKEYQKELFDPSKPRKTND